MGARRGEQGGAVASPWKIKKRFKRKKITSKILTCKRPHRMLCEEIFSQKAPMLCVKYSKRPPCYALYFCLERPP